jgi:hypothetical protein
MNQGVRGRALMKKTTGKISRVSVPLTGDTDTKCPWSEIDFWYFKVTEKQNVNLMSL